MRIGFIGTGHIAAPMARALARDGREVVVSERGRETAAALSAAFDNIAVAPNQGVLDGADIVFLCLRPQLAEDGLAGLAFRADHRVVSVMAGVPISRLQTLCAPATDISMTIPLGFVEQGGCPLPAFPGPEPLAALFGARNPVIPVASEAALNDHFAICAMVPGVLSMLDAAADWLGERTGDRRSAERYAAGLMGGFLAAMPQDGNGRLAQERDALATEGSLSLQMVDGLADGGALDALRDTLDAIGRRLKG